MKIQVEYNLEDLSLEQVYFVYKFVIQNNDKKNVDIVLDFMKLKLQSIWGSDSDLNIFKYYEVDSFNNFIKDPVKAFESLIDIEAFNRFKHCSFSAKFDPKDLRK